MDTIIEPNRHSYFIEVIYVDIDGCMKGFKMGGFGKDRADNISTACKEINATKGRAGVYAFKLALKA